MLSLLGRGRVYLSITYPLCQYKGVVASFVILLWSAVGVSLLYQRHTFRLARFFCG